MASMITYSSPECSRSLTRALAVKNKWDPKLDNIDAQIYAKIDADHVSDKYPTFDPEFNQH